MNRFVNLLAACLLALCPLAAFSAALPMASKVSGQVYAPTAPLFHANGLVAWYGVRQGSDYQEEFAFHLPDGRICWGGMKQLDSEYDYSKYGAFWWDSGERAWGGYTQDPSAFSISNKAGFYHRNGSLCWSGVPQERNSFRNDWNYAQRHSFKHDNGEIAWGGCSQMDLQEFSKAGAVYHSNGKLAWRGTQGAPVYDANGSLVALNADFVTITLGTGASLFVDYTGRFEVKFHLAEGMQLRMGRRSVYFDVYSLTMEVTP